MKPLHRQAFAPRRSGFTLLEVAVALVIFVLGALSIIQLFPPGLALVQSSGQRSTASSLNSGLHSLLSSQPDLLPDGVYEAGAYGGAVVGTSRRNNSLPKIPIDAVENEFQNSALDKFRRVTGERHVIPAGGARYLLTRVPYRDGVLVYQEAEVEGVTVDGTGKLNFAGTTVGNPGATMPAASFRYSDGATPDDTTFYVSYRWKNTALDNNVEGVIDEPFICPDTAITNPDLGAVAEPTHLVIPGPVKVRLRKLVVNTALTTGTAPSDEDEAAGYIDINVPKTPPTPPRVPELSALPAGQTLSLDYEVKDWRWLTSDAVPTGDEGIGDIVTSRLSLPAGPLNSELPTFFVARYDDGTTVFSSDNNSMNNAEGNVSDVDEKSATLEVQVRHATPPVALRVAYRTLDNWTEQLAVAARSYKPVTASNISVFAATQESWRNYYSEDGILYFQPSEVGKAVYVTYLFLDGTVQQVHRKLITIQADQIDKPASVPAALAENSVETGNAVVAKLELTDKLGNPLSAGNFRGVVAVEGASIMARTAWISGNKYNQSASISYRRFK